MKIPSPAFIDGEMVTEFFAKDGRTEPTERPMHRGDRAAGR
jgi:hypothetical protein